MHHNAFNVFNWVLVGFAGGPLPEEPTLLHLEGAASPGKIPGVR
jgi:hypothetical protein